MKIFITLSLFFFSVLSFSQPNINWQHTFGGTADDFEPVVISTSGNGMLVAGSTQSDDIDVSANHGNYDIWVIRLDASGNQLWQKSYGGSLGEFVNSIMQCSDGNFIILGSSQSSDGDLTTNAGFADLWILKINSSGDILWQNTFGGSSNDEGMEVYEDALGNFWVTGNTESTDGDITSNHGMTDIWVLKLDNAGSLIWQKTFGGSKDDYGCSISETDSSLFIIAGYSYSEDNDITTHYGQTDKCDYLALNISDTGDLIWAKNYGGNENDNLSGMYTTYDGYILYGSSDSDNGNITGCHGFFDGWMIKINVYGGVLWQKSVGGTGNDYLSCLTQNTDGYLYASGSTYSSDGDVSENKGEADCWLLKLDPNGPLQWSSTFGGALSDISNSLIILNDENAVIAASTYSSDGDITDNLGLFDYWIMKTSSIASIEDNASALNNFMISPNPASEQIRILFPENTTSPAILTISDISGRIIMQSVYQGNNSEMFDISAIPSGIYFVNIKCEYLDSYKKFIIN